MIGRSAVVVSHLSRGGIVWLALALLIGRGQRNVKGARGVSVTTIVSAQLVSSALARLVGRTRPCKRGRRPLIPCPNGGSFPSDQASAAFAAAVLLGWLQPRHGQLSP